MLRIDIGTPSAGHHAAAAEDSMMTTVPDSWYTTGPAGRVLDLAVARVGLRRLSVRGGLRIGEILHHAVWVITGDPAALAEVGHPGHCATCLSSMDQAAAYLRDHPGREVAAGTLYWI
jgi:hypothetical protein